MTPTESSKIMSRLAAIEHIGAAPELSLKLFSLAKDPTISINDIIECLRPNPAVCLAILKLANSAHFSRGNTLTNLPQAALHLGLTTVCNLVSAIELIGLFKSNTNATQFSDTTFWKHSYAGALIAKSVALSQGVSDPENTYLAALMRDLGILIMRQHFPDIFYDIYSMSRSLRLSFEQTAESLGYPTHRTFSYFLAMRWNLPSSILFVYNPPISTLKEYPTIEHDRIIISYTDSLLQEYGFCQWNRHMRFQEDHARVITLTPEQKDQLVAPIFNEVSLFSDSMDLPR